MTGHHPPATLDYLQARVKVELRAERLRLYQASAISSAASQATVACFLVAALWGSVTSERLLGWLACLAFMLLVRLLIWRAHRLAASGEAESSSRLWQVRLGLAFSGAIWGLAGLLLFPAHDLQYQAFLAFVLAGLAAGSLTLVAFDLVGSLGFGVLTLAPMSLNLLSAGGRTGATMAAMVMMFSAFLALIGLRAQRNVRDTVALRSAESLRAETLLRNQERLQQLSAELTRKTEALELTLDSMAQGILSVDSDGRTNFFNQRLVQLIDLPESFLASRPTMAEISRYQNERGHFGADLSLMDETARGTLARWNEGESPPFPPSYFRRTLSGAMLEVKTRYLPDGGLVRTFSDVTPYFEAQQKLKDSEAQSRKLALVAAHTDNAVAITDAGRRIEWVNEGFTRLTGYRLEEIVGRRASEFLRSPDTDAADVGRMDEQLGRERRADGEVLHRAKDGRTYWFAVETQAILDDAGQVRQYISIGRDVSERKAAEAALRAARDEAQRASRTKSEFLSAMSHELRTPMNAILGFGQLLASDKSFVLPDRQLGQVREILRAGSHLLELINDVLDLARVEAGKQPVIIEPVEVRALLDDCLALMRPAAQERGIRLEGGQPVARDCCVAADRTRLKQVLLNLMSNAVKYNREHGHVRIACQADGDAMRLSVSDTGPGLGTEQRERLFNAFERLGADDGPIEGAGIGLVLSKRLVELMHGSIGIDSEEGRGSTFWVRLPQAHPAALPDPSRRPAAQTMPAPLSAEGSNTVLYIEDNPVNVLLMEAMLEREPGVRLITAQDPEQGLTLAHTEQPQLILLDIQLPGMDGFEVLRRLRGTESARTTPVIAISANAMRGDIQQGLDAGFDAYLTKPLDMAQLRATVRRALHSRSKSTTQDCTMRC